MNTSNQCCDKCLDIKNYDEFGFHQRLPYCKNPTCSCHPLKVGDESPTIIETIEKEQEECTGHRCLHETAEDHYVITKPSFHSALLRAYDAGTETGYWNGIEASCGKHERCKTCKACHHAACSMFEPPIKSCYDSLLNKK